MKKVAVIGAAGRMGRWFMHYFAQSKTVKIFVHDKRNHAFRIPDCVHVCRTIRTCVEEADLVIICVPIGSIVSVVQECLTYMKEGAAILEISSIKKQIYSVLRAARKDVTCLCIHPMFGPATKKTRIIKNLLIPVRNRTKELRYLHSIFPRSEIEVIPDPDLHDKYMAVVLGLTYYVNLVLGSMLSKLDLRTLKKVAGTSFGMQAMITESILNDPPELVTALLRENSFNKTYIADFIAEAENIGKLVAYKDERHARKAVEAIKSRMNGLTDTNKSYLNFYKAIEYLKIFDSEKGN